MRGTLLVTAFAAGAVAGCASSGLELSQEKVAGWPQLRIYEHYVSHSEMQTRCARYVARYGAQALACAEFNFSEGRCDIWYSRELGATPELVRHERLHCLGYDHRGEGGMAKMLAAWEERQRFSARLVP